jgi:hypothetical protein
MLLPALFALSIAYLLLAPLAIVATLASLLMRAADGVEVAVVVTRRRTDGHRGQRTIASARINRASLTRAAGHALALTGRALTVIRSTARRCARTADRQADRAGAMSLCLAVWLAPWSALELAAGAGYAVAPYAIALALGGAWIRAARPGVAELVARSDGPTIGR